MPPVRPIRATLDERLDQIHSEIEALIEDRIALEAAENPGVPQVVLRQMFNSRFGACHCAAYRAALRD